MQAILDSFRSVPPEGKAPSPHGAIPGRLRPSAVALSITLMVLHAILHSAQMPIGPMPTASGSLIESSRVPAWLYPFSNVQLELASGVRLELVEIAVVSSERQKRAALIGILRNRSGALSNVALTLQYVSSDGRSVVSTVPNTALVSEVAAGGLLPFKFPLLGRDSLPGDVLSLRILLGENPGSGRLVHTVVRTDYSFHGQSADGARIAGSVETSPDGDVPFSQDGRGVITVLLLDRSGKLLDVLAGRAESRPDVNIYRFEFASFLPIASRVKSVRTYLELAPDIK